MSAKPGFVEEYLAGRLLKTAEAHRAALIDELETLRHSATGAGSPTVPPSPVLVLVQAGNFLSARFAAKVESAITNGELDKAVADLGRLRCSGAVRETCRVLLAYFLKYRFIDLSEVLLPPSTSGGYEGSMELCWDVPDGADHLWMNALWDAEPAATTAATMLSSRVTAIPWLGHLNSQEIVRAVAWLTETGFLEFAYDTEVEANGVPIPPGIGVLRLRPSFQLGDQDIQAEYAELIRSAFRSERRRRDLVADLGTGVRAVGAFETYRLIADSSPNDVLKISTYHLRTVVGERPLTEWLQDKRTLRIRIMCLGPTTADALTEGADPTSLTSSLIQGIQSFRRVRDDLPKDLRDKISIRVYGDVEEQALFRGAILCDAERGETPTSKRAVVTVWPFGECRANYGDILLLEGDSNLNRLLVSYYDEAWENSVPLPFFRRLDVLSWTLWSVRFELLTALLVGIIASFILVGQPNWGGDAFFALLAVVPVLALGLLRVGGRAWRAARLSLAVGRRLH